jgi:hypothetical protein
MINYIQSNQYILHDKKIINNDIWEDITREITRREITHREITHREITHREITHREITHDKLEKISIEYNIDIKNIVKDYLNYLIRNKPHLLQSEKFLNFVENVVHLTEPNTEYIKQYTIETLRVLMLQK